MYERFIEALESYRNVLDKGDEAALEAAVALMRAAQPEDEAAERAHCERVTALNGHVMRLAADLLLRERAAARAEIESLRRKLHDLQSYQPGSSGFYEMLLDQLRADVNARQARIDELGARLERLGYGPDEEP